MQKQKAPYKFVKKLMTPVAVLFFIFFLYVLFHAYNPVDNRTRSVTVNIPKGTGFLNTVTILENEGLIKNKYLFYALAVSKNAQSHIKAGEYELETSMSPMDIINKLVKGDIISYPVTFPEDFTVREIASRLASYNLVEEGVFLSLSSDITFLASLGIEGRHAEGYLYPDTYLFDKSMSAKDIMRMMVHQFWKMFTPEMRKRTSEMGMTIPKIVTMASLIGKETGYREEKPLISAVFYNRLKKRMKLQCDPTAVYDLKNFSGIITKKHLSRYTPYNTYLISGLPPGPIANPAIDSLQAALYPAPVNYLYFVSNNDGSHQFSSSLSAHQKAVLKYQIKRKKE